MIRSHLHLCFVSVSLVLFHSALSFGQDFGQGVFKTKKTVTLHRKLPAAVPVKDGTLSVEASSPEAKDIQATHKLRDTLQTELLKYNNRFKIDDTKPDLTVSCKITDLIIPAPKLVTRNVATRVKSGNKWVTQQQPHQYQEISGSVNVAYELKNVRAGTVMDADNLKTKYNQEFDASGNKTDKSSASKLTDVFGSTGVGNIFGKKKQPEEKNDETAPTVPQLEQILIGRIVQQITARITTTDEKVEVQLARGPSLDQYNDFAEKALWNRMLEPLETMKPLATPEEDAFRLYNIGVGYEALAYQAEEVKAAKKYLDEAAVNYGKAVDANPHEKEFLNAQNRIATAQSHYAKLGSNQQPIHVATVLPPTVTTPVTVNEHVPSGESQKPKAGSPGDALTNAQIIEFVKQGLDEENLIGMINDAPKVDLDASPSGVMELLKGGVKGKVLAAVRNRARPVPTRRATNGTPARKTSASASAPKQ